MWNICKLLLKQFIYIVGYAMDISLNCSNMENGRLYKAVYVELRKKQPTQYYNVQYFIWMFLKKLTTTIITTYIPVLILMIHTY